MATTLSQYGITWTWVEDRETGTFANGDYWVVGPITLTGITPETAIIGGRRANGSMVNPAPANYAPQGFDASLLGYSDSLNIALVGGNPLSVSNTRSVPASSSICTVKSKAVAGFQVLDDFGVLTVLASAPASGSFRPPYTGTDKTISWNKSQLNYGILRNLAPVTGQSAPTSSSFSKSWLEIEMDTDKNRQWSPTNHQPGYDRDNSQRFGGALLELHTNYSNAEKELAYVRLVQYGIDVYGQVKNGTWTVVGTVYSGLNGSAQTKPALVLAALALDDADMKTYVDGPNFVDNPYKWSPLGIPRFLADSIFWYVGDVNNSDDVGRPLELGSQQYVAGDVGKAEWGPLHWGARFKDSAAWSKSYRDVRYEGHVGLALCMRLTVGAVELWNNQVFFDYHDRAFAIYTGGSVPDPTPPYVKLFWDAYRNLGLNTPLQSIQNAGSPRSTYLLDSVRTVTLTGGSNAESIYYTLNGDVPTNTASATCFLYTAPFTVSSAVAAIKWKSFASGETPSPIGNIAISFVTATHPCAPVNLTLS